MAREGVTAAVLCGEKSPKPTEQGGSGRRIRPRNQLGAENKEVSSRGDSQEKNSRPHYRQKPKARQ